MKILNFLLIFVVFVSIDAKIDKVFDWQPQQIHIGYGGSYLTIEFISVNFHYFETFFDFQIIFHRNCS